GLRAMQSEVQSQISALTAAENSVSTARASLLTFQADLERSNLERSNPQVELKHASSLLEERVPSGHPYDTAKKRDGPAPASVNAAKARVDQAQVQVNDAMIRVDQAKTAIEAAKARAAQQQANLAQQSDLLRKTTQYATIDGVIGGPIVQVGTYALANFS